MLLTCCVIYLVHWTCHHWNTSCHFSLTVSCAVFLCTDLMDTEVLLGWLAGCPMSELAREWSQQAICIQTPWHLALSAIWHLGLMSCACSGMLWPQPLEQLPFTVLCNFLYDTTSFISESYFLQVGCQFIAWNHTGFLFVLMSWILHLSLDICHSDILSCVIWHWWLGEHLTWQFQP